MHFWLIGNIMLNEIKLFKPGFLTPAMGSTEADTTWAMLEEVRLTPHGSATSVAATDVWDDDALAQLQQQQQQQHLLEEAQQQLQQLEHEQKAQEQLQAQGQDASMNWMQQLLEKEQQLQQQQQQLHEQQQQLQQQQQQQQQQLQEQQQKD